MITHLNLPFSMTVAGSARWSVPKSLDAGLLEIKPHRGVRSGPGAAHLDRSAADENDRRARFCCVFFHCRAFFRCWLRTGRAQRPGGGWLAGSPGASAERTYDWAKYFNVNEG